MQQELTEELTPDIISALFGEPVEVGWVKGCEGRLLRIGDCIAGFDSIDVCINDIFKKDEQLLYCCSISIPGTINRWAVLNECLSTRYDRYTNRTTYYFEGRISEKLRQLFSI
jgi:hypothetical protein